MAYEAHRLVTVEVVSRAESNCQMLSAQLTYAKPSDMSWIEKMNHGLIHLSLEDISRYLDKDHIAIITSAVALFFTSLSYRQRQKEGSISLRKQLSDIIKNLLDINTEFAKFAANPGDYPKNYNRLLADQRRFFSRQGLFLAKKLGGLSPYEWLVLAEGYNGSDNPYEAERLFRKAIAAAGDAVEKCIMMRTYARFLFHDQRQAESLEAYEKAVRFVRNKKGDRFRNYEADTYFRLGEVQREWGIETAAIKSFGRARDIYGQIENPARKTFELTRVEKAQAPRQVAPENKAPGGGSAPAPVA